MKLGKSFWGNLWKFSEFRIITLLVNTKIMKPNRKWIKDWAIGEDTLREFQIAEELLKVFSCFWEAQELDQKSKSTRNRYSAALHSLGGYLVEKAIYEEEDLNKNSDDLLTEYVSQDEGPLICFDHEIWQNEIDMVCRKLYKHLNSFHPERKTFRMKTK